MEREQLATRLLDASDDLSAKRVVTGFDGFVDEMLSVVETRRSQDHYERVPTIARFGELVSAAAGHSSLREAVVTAVEPGGCAVNMGDGLAALGVSVDTFATLGDPVHPAFAAYAKVARLRSWGDTPGRTLAMEFDDGKLMLSHVSQLADFTAEYVAGRLADGDFELTCREASLLALCDWALYPHMTDVWRLLNREVLAKLDGRRPLLIDLVDPSSRNDEDIAAMLRALPELNATCAATLGVNQNEANVLGRLAGIATVSPADTVASADQASALRERFGVDEVVLHTHRFAVLAEPTRTTVVHGPYSASPRKSTGAGDRFNAGYAIGVMLGLAAKDRLRLATATSGAFVRLGRSATAAETAAILRDSKAWPDSD